MTLSSATSRVSYTGNGAVDTYAYTFKIFSQEDLLVTVRDTDDVETTLVLTTDYTVTGAGATAGGNVVLVNASQAWLDVDGDLKSNYVISIRRVRDLIQETDIRNQGAFYPEIHEDQFDILVMQDQQQQDEINRSVKLPETISSADFDPTLPTDITTANVVLKVNATGDGFESGPTTTAIEDAEANATAAAASAVAAAASASAASGSAVAAAASAAAAALGTFTGAILMDEIATPSTPASGKMKIYPKADNQLYFLNDGGVETRVGGNQGSNLLVNIGLAASVAANALTVAIKNSSGSDASTTSPIYAAFGNATITTGQFEVISLTAALSLVVSSGSTLGQQNAIAADIYVYLINNAGTIKIGLSRIKLPEDALYTTVAEGGAGGADSSSTLYSDAVYANVRVRCVGKITSTQATAGTWATAPSSITLNPLPDQYIGFRGTTNAGQAVTSGNAILFEDPIWDEVGGYNSATGVYTFKAVGKYRYSACITSDSVSASIGNSFVIEAQKDAAFYSRGKYDVCEDTTSRIFVSNISDTIDAVVGTTLAFVFAETLPAVNLTADGRYNYMSIEKIS